MIYLQSNAFVRRFDNDFSTTMYYNFFKRNNNIIRIFDVLLRGGNVINCDIFEYGRMPVMNYINNNDRS